MSLLMTSHGRFSMEIMPSTGHLNSIDVAPADDMEPEDMKSRRLAALEEFGIRNPQYQKLIKAQLKLERRGATDHSLASRRKLNCKDGLNGQIKRTYQRVAGKRIKKKSWWTTESSLALLDAVTRFEKSASHAIGENKWKIIAADLMQQPECPGMSLTECAKYCRIRYSNMLTRRNEVGSSYALKDEVKEKVEEFCRLVLDARPLSRPRGKKPRK